MDKLFASLDWIQRRAWSIGFRFQWPCWLLDRAWNRRARPYCPSAAEFAAYLDSTGEEVQ
jgi:hypothetical protein